MTYDVETITPAEAWKLPVKERRLLAADLLEREKKLEFAMSTWVDFDSRAYLGKSVVEIADAPDMCGTSACIAGTVTFWLDPVGTIGWARAGDEDLIENMAAKFLGLTPGHIDTYRLFTTAYASMPVGQVTKAMAVAALRRFAEGELVDWDEIAEEGSG